MTLDEAMEIVRNVCGQVQTNLATHQKIQEALSVIHRSLPKPKNEKVKPEQVEIMEPDVTK